MELDLELAAPRALTIVEEQGIVDDCATVGTTYAGGITANRNAGNPNAWPVDFDKSQQAFTDTLDRILSGRITWQATPRSRCSASRAAR